MVVERLRPVMYGGESKNTCAFCKKHKKYLTPKQMRVRNCTAYNCKALVRLDHKVWDQKSKAKELRKIRKARMEKLYQESTHAI